MSLVVAVEFIGGRESDSRQTIVHYIMALVLWADHITKHGESHDEPDGADDLMDTRYPPIQYLSAMVGIHLNPHWIEVVHTW